MSSPNPSLLVLLLAAGMVAASAGCARPAARSGPIGVPFPGDPALSAILAMDPGAAQLDSLEVYEARRYGHMITDTLADIAEDTTVDPLFRANALLLVGRRHEARHFIVLRPLLSASDPRIRLAVVMAAREYLPGRPEAALALLAEALNDPSEAVQARALEGMTDRLIEPLREYVRRSPSPGLARVAEGLIAAAEERGAPLEPDSAGRLSRSGPGGHRLSYRPTRSWPRTGVSMGVLQLAPSGAPPVTLGDSIEVARAVVPAFFSSDGQFLVYEKRREIRVRNVATGAERTVGPGIAPRPLPFTDSFIYARRIEGAAREGGAETGLEYELHRVPFAASPVPAEPDVVGTISAKSTFAVAGGASPVRWMRVVESEGYFRLEGDGMDPVPLPDPFSARTGG